MEFSDSNASGYRVFRSGNNIIYTGKISQEGAAEFQRGTYDAIAELKKNQIQQKKAAENKGAADKANSSLTVKPNPSGPGSNVNGTTPTEPQPEPVAVPTEIPTKDVAAVPPAKVPKSESDNYSSMYSECYSGSDNVTASSYNSSSSAEYVNSNNMISNDAPNPYVSEKTEKCSVSNSEDKQGNNTLRFHFSSAGGNLPAGMAMMDMVEEANRLGYNTECHSKGFVGSAATFPAFACKQRFSTPHTLFLLHPPAKSGVNGQTEEMQIHSQNLDLWHSTSLSVYHRLKRFAFPASENEKLEADKEIETTFKTNRYNTAQDIKRMGLIDYLFTPK